VPDTDKIKTRRPIKSRSPVIAAIRELNAV